MLSVGAVRFLWGLVDRERESRVYWVELSGDSLSCGEDQKRLNSNQREKKETQRSEPRKKKRNNNHRNKTKKNTPFPETMPEENQFDKKGHLLFCFFFSVLGRAHAGAEFGFLCVPSVYSAVTGSFFRCRSCALLFFVCRWRCGFLRFPFMSVLCCALFRAPVSLCV